MSATLKVRQPRRRRAPSPRDQALYIAFQTSGKTQAELAAEIGLSQVRVSQIVRRVEDWQSGLRSADERRQVEVQQAIYRGAMRRLHQSGPVVTVQTGPRGTETTARETTIRETTARETTARETTVRELPPDVRLLKIAQRACGELRRLEAAQPAPGGPDADERQRIMVQELVKLREAAWQSGRLRASSDPFPFVVSLLRALQGFAPLPWEDDEGLLELGDRLLWKRGRGRAGEPQPAERSDQSEPRPALLRPDEAARDSSFSTFKRLAENSP